MPKKEVAAALEENETSKDGVVPGKATKQEKVAAKINARIAEEEKKSSTAEDKATEKSPTEPTIRLKKVEDGIIMKEEVEKKPSYYAHGKLAGPLELTAKKMQSSEIN